MKAYVHRDIRGKIYSITVNGKVVEKTETVYVSDATFRVRPGGRARVLKQKKKNVHAFVIGKVKTSEMPSLPKNVIKVTYNPYVADTFLIANTSKAVHNASEVWLTPNGVYIRRKDAY